jgi:hypothetical protein
VGCFGSCLPWSRRWWGVVLGWSDDGGCWYSKPHIIGIGAAGKQNCRGEVEGFVWGGGPRVGLRTAVQPWAGGRNPDRVVNLFWGGPRVGLRAAVQPWAGGRNPVGIGRGDGIGIGGHRREASQGRPFVQSNRGGRNPDRVVDLFWGGPRVGLRAAVQPWAGGRNPVGIGRGDGVGIGGHRRDASAALIVGLGDAIPLGLGIWWGWASAGTREGWRARAGWEGAEGDLGATGGSCGDKAGTALLRWLLRRRGWDGLVRC